MILSRFFLRLALRGWLNTASFAQLDVHGWLFTAGSTRTFRGFMELESRVKPTMSLRAMGGDYLGAAISFPPYEFISYSELSHAACQSVSQSFCLSARLSLRVFQSHTVRLNDCLSVGPVFMSICVLSVFLPVCTSHSPSLSLSPPIPPTPEGT